MRFFCFISYIFILGWTLAIKRLKNIRNNKKKIRLYSTVKNNFRHQWDIFIEFSAARLNLPIDKAKSIIDSSLGYGAQEKYDKVIELSKKAITLCPLMHEAYGNLGISLRLSGYIYLSILCHIESIKIFYFDEKAHHNLAIAYSEIGKNDEAISSYFESALLDINYNLNNLELALKEKKIQESKTKDINFHRLNYNELIKRGNKKFSSGDWRQAEKYFLSAISLNSDFPEAFFRLGIVYQSIGRYKSAAENIEKYVDVILKFKNNSKFKLDAAYHALGLCYGHIGLPTNDSKYIEMSMNMFKKSIHLNPDIGENYHLLGGIFLRQKKIEKAIEYLLKAIKILPDLDIAYGELGQAYLEIGNKLKAIEFYRLAHKINPDNPTHIYNLSLLQGD